MPQEKAHYKSLHSHFLKLLAFYMGVHEGSIRAHFNIFQVSGLETQCLSMNNTNQFEIVNVCRR